MITKETRFLIVGLGLLGGSYAMGLKEAGYTVYGVARRQETIDHALAHGLIDEGTIDPEALLPQADIVIFGLYPHIMIDWISAHQHAFRPGTLLSDVSGVKVNVADRIQQMLRDDVEFIAAHPMAGRETSGIEYADVPRRQLHHRPDRTQQRGSGAHIAAACRDPALPSYRRPQHAGA